MRKQCFGVGGGATWMIGYTLLIRKIESMIIKIFKTVAVLTIMISAVWMAVGMILLVIMAK
jgi:hypothetical protein